MIREGRVTDSIWGMFFQYGVRKHIVMCDVCSSNFQRRRTFEILIGMLKEYSHKRNALQKFFGVVAREIAHRNSKTHSLDEVQQLIAFTVLSPEKVQKYSRALEIIFSEYILFQAGKALEMDEFSHVRVLLMQPELNEAQKDFNMQVHKIIIELQKIFRSIFFHNPHTTPGEELYKIMQILEYKYDVEPSFGLQGDHDLTNEELNYGASPLPHRVLQSETKDLWEVQGVLQEFLDSFVNKEDIITVLFGMNNPQTETSEN